MSASSASTVSSACQYLKSTIGKKTLMGLTGLGISGFVFAHMAGNLLMLCSAETYNDYGHKITSNKAFLYTAEAGLIFLFFTHIILALQLTARNRASRPVGYAQGARGEKHTRLAAQTLILSGLLLLAFLVLHLITFKYGEYYPVTYNGVEVRDLHRLVMEKFQSPGYVAWYLLCLFLLGAHLSHGVAACFQSIGVLSSKHPMLKKIAWGFAAIVTLGFMSQPIYAFFFYNSNR